MMFFMQSFLSTESLHPFWKTSLFFKCYMMIYLTPMFLKFLAIFVLLPLYNLIKLNYNLKPENLFSWVTSLAIRAMFYLICLITPFLSPEMLPRSILWSVFLDLTHDNVPTTQETKIIFPKLLGVSKNKGSTKLIRDFWNVALFLPYGDGE